MARIRGIASWNTIRKIRITCMSEGKGLTLGTELQRTLLIRTDQTNIM